MDGMRKFWFCVGIFAATCGLAIGKIIDQSAWLMVAKSILWGFIIGNGIEYLPDMLNNDKNKPA